MPAYHKRLAAHRDTQFRRPEFSCYACHDTGLLVNSDGLLRHYLPDYDSLPDGRPMGGSDLALVCWCSAAYAERGPDGQITRGGFREDSGDIRKVSTANGLQPVGVGLSKEITRELHSRRREQWLEAERVMSEARERGEAPWFITESRVLLDQLPKGKAGAGGLQSIGSILGAGADERAA